MYNVNKLLNIQTVVYISATHEDAQVYQRTGWTMQGLTEPILECRKLL